MGAGQHHWPEDIRNNDMDEAVKDPGWATKPFQAKTNLGIGIKMACPCGCHTVGVYELTEKDGYEIDWASTVYLDPSPVLNVKRNRVRVWSLVSVQSAYGPDQGSHRQLANKMAAMIPGIGDFVASPCNCKPFKRAIWGMIQHLNDVHHPTHGDGKSDDLWSRERIADWLETLDADLVLDPDYKAPAPPVPTYEEQVAMIEQITTNMSQSISTLKSYFDEMSVTIAKFAESITIPKPTLKVKDVHALSAALVIGGEEEMAKVMAEKGITTMDLEEASMQPHSIEKHEPCLCLICKMHEKKTNQEES